MLLRDLLKTNNINDGTRSLVESILIPEIAKALADWKHVTKSDAVLVGGLAAAFYAKPRATTDIDLLFLSEREIPDSVPGFKRIRPSAFQHNQTHVEIEILLPRTINLPEHIAKRVFETANTIDGIKIASPSAIVALKLHRLKRYDEGDIISLIETGKVDLTGWELTQDQLNKFEEIKAKV